MDRLLPPVGRAGLKQLLYEPVVVGAWCLVLDASGCGAMINN